MIGARYNQNTSAYEIINTWPVPNDSFDAMWGVQEMRQVNVPEPLAEIIRAYCNVDVYDGQHGSLGGMLGREENADQRRLFREQLAEAILKHTISLKDYEKLTDEDFDTEEELEERLRELWNGVFPGETASMG